MPEETKKIYKLVRDIRKNKNKEQNKTNTHILETLPAPH